MLLAMETYLRQGQRQLRRLALDPRVQLGVRTAAYGTGGLLLSAASLGNFAQPLAMGAVCGVTGWRALVMGLGAVLGYWVFWGMAGVQAMVWAALGTLLALFGGKRKEIEEMPLLLPAAAALAIAVTGLLFQILWQEDTPLRVYLLRIGVAALSTLLARQVVTTRDAFTDWVAGGVAVLALAQVMPIPYVGLGYIAAGAIGVGSPFPAAALAGLGLDLARVTAVPMGVTVCAAYFVRLLPFREKWVRCIAPGASYLAVSALCGIWDAVPLPGLLIGGVVGYLLPPRGQVYHRRGETGVAQVRLEMASGVFSYTQQLLLETEPPPIDEAAILQKVRQRACGSCSARSACREQEGLNATVLNNPLDFTCRKTGRVLGELRRGQEQLRQLKAEHLRQREYRMALTQQYQFLAEYLRRLSDQLSYRGERRSARYRLELSARGRGKERTNGDTCMAFPGTGCRYYILLCDGMGTGPGAAREGKTAAELMRQMLLSGFPPEAACRSVNSILALRGQAAAVTLDVAEVRLDTGRAALFKWGAASSYILRRAGPEKVGSNSAPPGITVGDSRETVIRFSLHRGETLVMASDGADIGNLLKQTPNAPDIPPAELAEKLASSCTGSGDDATVAVMRLRPIS